MIVYAKGSVGDAWQYNGDIESMPDWTKESSGHHIEVKKDGDIYYWSGNEHMRVDEGDWFVMFCDGTVHLWGEYSFKSRFTFSDPAHCKDDTALLKKYRLKTDVVDAWQYTGKVCISELPCWVADLILYNRLGYRPGIDPKTKNMEIMFMFCNEDNMWIPLSVGDWLVRGEPNLLGILSSNNGTDPIVVRVTCDDFKEFFEEIK